MADEVHLAVLKQGADAWNAWRAAHSGTAADLADASLRGLDLGLGDNCRQGGAVGEHRVAGHQCAGKEQPEGSTGQRLIPRRAPRFEPWRVRIWSGVCVGQVSLR
jgi:hypothetical protein